MFSVVPLAVSGPLVIGVTIAGALALLGVLFRAEDDVEHHEDDIEH